MLQLCSTYQYNELISRMRLANVTRTFRLPPEPRHRFKSLPPLYSHSPPISSANHDFKKILLLTYLLISFSLINVYGSYAITRAKYVVEIFLLEYL